MIADEFTKRDAHYFMSLLSTMITAHSRLFSHEDFLLIFVFHILTDEK